MSGQTRPTSRRRPTRSSPAWPTQPDLANLKSDLVKATPEVQVTVDPNKAIAVGMTAAQVAGQVRAALVAQTGHDVQSADGQPIALVVQLDPGGGRRRSTTSRPCPSGPSRRSRSATIATVEQVDVQGSITRIDQRPAASITAEITSDDTGAVSQSVQAELDALEAAGAFPAGTTVELAGVSQQQSEAFGGLFASMGVADPARLRDDGPDLQLARHPVHHPVHPAARDDRRLPGAATSPAGRSASARSSAS